MLQVFIFSSRLDSCMAVRESPPTAPALLGSLQSPFVIPVWLMIVLLFLLCMHISLLSHLHNESNGKPVNMTHDYFPMRLKQIAKDLNFFLDDRFPLWLSAYKEMICSPINSVILLYFVIVVDTLRFTVNCSLALILPSTSFFFFLLNRLVPVGIKIV